MKPKYVTFFRSEGGDRRLPLSCFESCAIEGVLERDAEPYIDFVDLLRASDVVINNVCTFLQTRTAEASTLSSVRKDSNKHNFTLFKEALNFIGCDISELLKGVELNEKRDLEAEERNLEMREWEEKMSMSVMDLSDSYNKAIRQIIQSIPLKELEKGGYRLPEETNFVTVRDCHDHSYHNNLRRMGRVEVSFHLPNPQHFSNGRQQEIHRTMEKIHRANEYRHHNGHFPQYYRDLTDSSIYIELT